VHRPGGWHSLAAAACGGPWEAFLIAARRHHDPSAVGRMRDRLNEIYAKHTGQDLSVVAANLDRDRYFDAAEAKEFGLIDEVVQKRPRGI
jgi:hypothetical protein